MMNLIKKWAGIIWMLAGPLTMYCLIRIAASEIALKPELDTKIQWGVFVIIFLPIALGLVIFGYYAFSGEYDHLPENSDELT